MTNEEALKELKTVCYGMDRELERVIIDALEKQMPKDPLTLKSKKSDDGYYICPNCKSEIMLIGFDAYRKAHNRDNHCDICGQALNWHDDEGT